MRAGREELVSVQPLVQDMVDALDDAQALDTWQAVIDVASTRYSTSAGCATAAAWVGVAPARLRMAAARAAASFWAAV